MTPGGLVKHSPQTGCVPEFAEAETKSDPGFVCVDRADL